MTTVNCNSDQCLFFNTLHLYSASASINHGLVSAGDGNTTNSNEDHGTAPMDIKERPFLQVRASESQDFASCFLRFCGLLANL